MTMRATHSRVYIDRHGRRMKQMSLAQRTILRKAYIRQSPGWRHPLVGYILCPFIIAVAMVCTLFLQKALNIVHFASAFPILAILLVALFWGVGPALIAVALGTVLLDYYFVPPFGQIMAGTWRDTIQLVPFIIAGCTIALITAQRERARLLALGAEQELQVYAEEMELANRKLEEADQMKDQFLSIASHELKTPVTSIRGHAQLTIHRLNKQKNASPEMEEIGMALKKINDQTTRLTNLIDDLMDVSSIRAGKLELRKQKSDLRDICREAVEDEHLLNGRPITLNMPERAVNVAVDRDRMAQVLLNLISNAIKYSPDGSPIEVILNERPSSALIQVKDSGKGIPKDQQTHIFEIFYRTPDAQTSSKRGLGLGLAISKNIVERHDGSIWCESEPGREALSSSSSQSRRLVSPGDYATYYPPIPARSPFLLLDGGEVDLCALLPAYAA
ncbi:MAG: HAMP domain-containing histidine kinase [Ktedonobacteraceae bacterium]|nr:HAMP domain-containing histidine kinase [Ktedonobacteraceae bacterium]